MSRISAKFWRFVLSVFLCLLTGELATAQGSDPKFCETIKSIYQSAASGFRPFRGREDQPDIYESKLTLPGAGADDCSIFTDPKVFQCDWRRFRNASERLEQAKALGTAVGTCITTGFSNHSIQSDSVYYRYYPDGDAASRRAGRVRIEINTLRNGNVVKFKVNYRD
jgi:hypothetical protein